MTDQEPLELAAKAAGITIGFSTMHSPEIAYNKNTTNEWYPLTMPPLAAQSSEPLRKSERK